MQLCAYLVVLVTLVGQGLTFGPLVRRLGLRANVAEEAQVRHDVPVNGSACSRSPKAFSRRRRSSRH